MSRRTSGAAAATRASSLAAACSADTSDHPSGLSSMIRVQPPSASAWIRRGARSRRSGERRSNHRSCGSSMCESAEILGRSAAVIVAPRAWAPQAALKKQSSVLKMESKILRRHDLSLSPDQDDLRAAFAAVFEKESPPERVRAAEPLGVDRGLWSALVATGLLTMALPEDAGGDGGGMVEGSLVAEQL